MTADARALADHLEASRLEEIEALLMPDFFLDHMMRFASLEDLAGALQNASSSNFNVLPERQLLRAGGGAAGIAHALARLGVRARLMCSTSPVGRTFLEGTLGRDGVDLSLVRDDGPLHVTGAIEASDSSVMLYTPQRHTGLAPESLRDDDWDAIARADGVYVGNWTNPRAHDLAAEVWRVAKRTQSVTFTDPGLPPEGPDRERILRSLASPHLDACSLNADELRAYAAKEELVEAGEALSTRLRTRVDLHSNELSASFRDGALLATAPHFPTSLHQATGAGDTWNAGALLGDLLGLPDAERLLLANALAALYVASERVEPPTLHDVTTFLRRSARVAREA